MDFQIDTMTENSLVALAKAGCMLDLKITSYGKAAQLRGKISNGNPEYGGPGFCLVLDAEGEDVASALRGAVATAETFMHCVPPRRPLPVLPEIKPPPAAADVMTDRDPVADRRDANRMYAAQQDERAHDLVTADQGLDR